jgi:hypothetical protein
MSAFVNSTSQNNPSSFGSNETSLEFGLPNQYRGNVAAANASLQRGGRISLARKIKNIVNKYKVSMSVKKRTLSKLRKKYGSVKRRKSQKKRNARTKRRQRGGYTQFGSNTPLCMGYSSAGVNLSASNLGLANPPPITAYPQQNWIR